VWRVSSTQWLSPSQGVPLMLCQALRPDIQDLTVPPPMR
jgi:hypothetical protein